MEDLLMSVLPENILIDIVSRLSGKIVCKLKCVSKSWLVFVSSNSEFKRLHRLRARRRPPLLVIAKTINDDSSPGLFIEKDTLPVGGFRVCCKVVFNSKFGFHFVASCRDFVCFYNGRDIYVYSPSTNQYLTFQTPVAPVGSHLWRFGVVYVASMKLYKIVKLEVHGDPDHLSRATPPTIRFEAITLQEEEEEGGSKHLIDEQGTCSWELISEHVMPSRLFGDLGNLIGVNGVAYTIVKIGEFDRIRVISLGFEAKDNKFKMFSLPQACCDEGNRHRHFSTNINLCQVKDVLCYPHSNTSTLDLWLLIDRNTCTWLKGYTITCNFPQPYGIFGPFSASAAAADDDAGAGLFLFDFDGHISQYNIRNKAVTYFFHDEYTQRLLVFSDNLYSLKNGLTCTRIPAAYIRSLERKRKAVIPHQTPPQGSLPPPPQGSLPPPPNSPNKPALKGEISHPSLPQGSLPQSSQLYSHPSLPQSSLPPPSPPPYSHPPPPQGSLRPPFYSHPPPPQGSLQPPPLPPHSNLPPPQGSLPTPPYYPQNLHPPLPQGLSLPPPPPPYNPHNLQHNINLSELKRRKLDS